MAIASRSTTWSWPPGATVNDFGIPGVAEHGFPLYVLPDAVRLRNHILGRFEAADADPSLVDDGDLTFVVVGGGPTGVEVAGALVELIDKVLHRDFRGARFDVRRAHVVLVEATDDLLPPFRPATRRYTRSTLSRRGVEVLTGASVAEVTPTRVVLGDGREIPTHTLVWAAGVQASPLARALGVPVGRGGRVVVGPDLRLPDHPEAFVIGDMAAIDDGAGGTLPGVAQVAMQGGRHVAALIERSVVGEGDPAEPFALPRQGVDGDDRPALGGGRDRTPHPPHRHTGLDRLARAAPAVPDGLPQPGVGLRELGVELPHVGPRRRA